MLKGLIAIVALAILSYFIFIPAQEKGPIPGSYVSDKLGFSIQFPDGWTIEEKSHHVTATRPTTGSDQPMYETINVKVETVPEEIQLDFLNVKVAACSQREFDHYVEEERNHIKIGGCEAIRTVNSFSVNGYKMNCLGYVLKKDDKGYFISCYALPQNFSMLRVEFERSVTSFRML